jgi:hypothetical protein
MQFTKILAVTMVSAGLACAQHTAAGKLRVIAQIEGSMSVVFTEPSGQTVRATGTSSATFTVPAIGGSFSAHAAPVTAGDASFSISSPFEIQVIAANLPSMSYTLRSRLQIADPVHSWTIDGVEISTGAVQVISTREPYGMPNPHSLTVGGPTTALNNLNNSITFQVIAN